MKFSEQWLREWVNPAVSSADLVKTLNFLGLEVDAVTPAAPEFSGVVVAQVKSVSPHPDADRLRVCQVDAGSGELLQVVCGAANVEAGMKAPLAMLGAVLPGDLQIKKGKLRGVESYGMLCSETELGLAEKAEGLMVLADAAPVGTDLRQYLQLNDVLIEVDLTPNRGDCLSVKGIAREIALATATKWQERPPAAVKATTKTQFPVEIQAPQACPRYVGRVIEGINPAAKSPLWLVEKLRRSGLRSIHPVVDVTNYVMLELGQPMHAFDLDRLQQGIVVRLARDGETLQLLDGSEAKLHADTLVIADARGACALAGIMGGENSAVGVTTQRIFLESAFFAPAAIQGRARRYGKHTDSSHRFERGVAPDLQQHAIEKASALIIEIAGGKAGPVSEVADKNYLPKQPVIQLRRARLHKILGCELEDKRVESILTGLGAVVKAGTGGWQVTPPVFRFDLAIEVDLIEELARIYGYKNLPRSVPAFRPTELQVSETDVPEATLTNVLIQQGYHEVVCYSFVDPKLQRLIEPDREAIALANPISADMSEMRVSLLPGLLNSLIYNVNRQQKHVQIFEIGARFLKQGSTIQEEMIISGLRYGAANHEHWNSKNRTADFYDIKGDVEKLLQFSAVQLRFEPEPHPALHPGQTAAVYVDGVRIGWLGAIHPGILRALDLPGETAYIFELALAPLLRGRVPAYSAISKYPAIRRDLSLEIDQSVGWTRFEECVLKAAPEYLSEVRLFDVYAGKGVTPGRKSLAIGLILQEISRTLTDVEIESAISRILRTLNQDLGATLRE
jgi:phenylalanyl-tRNA synthetase beta chain